MSAVAKAGSKADRLRSRLSINPDAPLAAPAPPRPAPAVDPAAPVGEPAPAEAPVTAVPEGGEPATESPVAGEPPAAEAPATADPAAEAPVVGEPPAPAEPPAGTAAPRSAPATTDPDAPRRTRRARASTTAAVNAVEDPAITPGRKDYRSFYVEDATFARFRAAIYWLSRREDATDEVPENMSVAVETWMADTAEALEQRFNDGEVFRMPPPSKRRRPAR